MHFPVRDVTDWSVARPEAEGSDSKIWLVDPADPVEAEGAPRAGWLFKPRAKREGRGHAEDWTEKLAAELAGLLGVPCARVELARRGNVPGSISRNLRPPGWTFHHGAELLADQLPGYQPNAPNRHGHSLPNIRSALAECLAPAEVTQPGLEAFSVFAGYLVLDAWIANRDRHDFNWAVLEPWEPGQRRTLAGSYDHGTSLGFNVTDGEREDRLRSRDPQRSVMSWAVRGTAWRFEHSVGYEPTLVAHAAAALRLAGGSIRAYWLDRLSSVTKPQVSGLTSQIPELSDPARMFAVELLDINRRRLLDEC